MAATNIPVSSHRSSTTPFDSAESRRILFARINRIHGLSHAKIVYFDGHSFTVLRPFPAMCLNKYRTIVIREVRDHKEITRIQHPQTSKQTEDRFYSELISTGLSCGAAVLSWLVIGGSSAAIPVSGGASTAITILAYSAATASSFQCTNSAYRLYNESDLGDPKKIQWLDSQDWYIHTSTALDAISLAGGITSAGATIKTILRLKAAGTPFRESLKGLDRQSRKRLTEEIIRANNPNISNKTLKALVAAGKYPKRFSNIEISNALRLQLKDAIGAALSFTGSASSGIVRHPNRLPKFITGIVEEFETY